jgi:hypothetical protein
MKKSISLLLLFSLLVCSNLFGQTSTILPFKPPTSGGCLSASPLFRVRASSLVLNDNDPISTITDEGSAGLNLTQATSANRPLYKIVSGRPEIDFDGVNDELTNSNPVFTTATEKTYYTVVRLSSATVTGAIFDVGSNGGGIGIGIGNTRYDPGWGGNNCVVLFESVAWIDHAGAIGQVGTGVQICGMVMRTTDRTLFHTTNASYSDSAAPNTAGGCTSMGSGCGNRYFSESVLEVIVYNAGHNQATIDANKDCLKTTYGI